MKVLLSAFYCLPTQGSDSAVGWNWAREIAARGHQVFVITRAVNRNAVETALSQDPTLHLQFLFHDLSPTIQTLAYRPFVSYLYYLLWQFTAAKVALRAHSSQHFDLVQHVTMATFRFPTFMWKLGVPLIFGPVGGGEDAPKKMRGGLGLRGRLWDWPRRLSNFLVAWDPLMKATYAHSTQIVVTTRETLQEIPFPYRSRSRVQPGIGTNPNGSQFSAGQTPKIPKTAGPAKVNMLFAGRLLPWKGLHLGLKAMAALGSEIPHVHLTVVGSGSDQGRLQRLARRLGIERSVTWIPWVERNDLIQFYFQANLFLFPSLHDSGGMAVLEAMSFGLPVLCLDLGGPALSVDDSCGCVIPVGDRSEKEVVHLISDCLAKLLSDAPLLESLSRGAREHVGSLTWQAVVAKTYGSFVV